MFPLSGRKKACEKKIMCYSVKANAIFTHGEIGDMGIYMITITISAAQKVK